MPRSHAPGIVTARHTYIPQLKLMQHIEYSHMDVHTLFPSATQGRPIIEPTPDLVERRFYQPAPAVENVHQYGAAMHPYNPMEIYRARVVDRGSSSAESTDESPPGELADDSDSDEPVAAYANQFGSAAFWEMIGVLEWKNVSEQQMTQRDIIARSTTLLRMPHPDRRGFLMQYDMYYANMHARLTADGMFERNAPLPEDQKKIVSHFIGLGFDAYATLMDDMIFCQALIMGGECHPFYKCVDSARAG